MTIKILDNSVINKIAAGEMIERPASVIKELIENSIDAGSTEIKIEVEDSGLRKIKITDNGCGMNPEDLLLSYKRHATSKISNDDDLFNIISLGFRGEALASIAEVANLKITTKQKDSVFGTFVEVEAGEMKKSNSCASPDGTIIEVSDLFFNVPARKKYLKGNDVEFSHILKTVMKYALIKKEISFKLVKNGKEVINSSQTDSLLTNISYIYGIGIAKDLIEVDFEKNGISVSGFISKPNLTRSDKNDQSLYVNSRYVRNSTVSNAIYDAYKTLLFIHRHPVFILNVDISPREIDVNVHPSKEVIKFTDEDFISEIIYEAVHHGFKKNSLVPDSDLTEESATKSLKEYQIKTDFQSNLEINSSKTFENDLLQEEKEIYNEPKKKHENFGPFVVLGQVNQTFIVANSPQGLAIIDQHAAEERVNYEKFMKEKKDNAIKSQKFLTPKVIELHPFQHHIAMNNYDFIRGLGYEFEDFGENSVKLSSVPEIFGRLKSILFIDIINEIEKNKGETINTQVEDRIIRFACRASIKAGDELTPFQMRELMRKLEECENPYTCPHGRPTIINFSFGDLEKKFKRK